MTPDLRNELRAMMPQLRDAAIGPAGKEGVTAIIGRRFVLFPQRERSEGEWLAWWADYHAALEDLPSEAIEAGMQAWVKQPDVEFLPKPGKLRELAQQTRTKAAATYERARGLLVDQRLLVGPGEPERREPTPEERAAIHRMAKETIAALTKPPSAKPHIFPPAKTDETGLTAAMREHLANHPASQRIAAE
jgi:hypothetical protein